MLMPWEHLLLVNVPRDGQGGDGPSGGPGGGPSGDGPGADGPGGEGDGDGGDDPGDAGDPGVAAIGSGPNATPGIGPGSLAEAAANIANTSGSPEAAMANAEATGNPGIASAVAGMLAGPSISAFAGDADIASPNAQEISGSLAALGLGGVFSGSSLASVASGVTEAVGPSQQGAFGLSGPVGVSTDTSPSMMASQGVSPSTDVSTATSTMGLADVSMGAFGPGGITGTGTSVDGVSGLGMGAGNISGGLSGIGSALGNTGVAGFAATETGFSTDDPSSMPFGGAPTSSNPQGYSSPSMGMGFGVGPAGISMGAPYSGASVDTGMLGATGVPGSRAEARTEQAAHLAAQEAAVMAQRSFGSPYVGSPGVVAPSVASVPSATPAPSAAPAPAPAPSAAPAPAPSPAPSQAPAQAISTGSSIAAVAAGLPGRSASSFSTDSFTDPLTGAQVSVTNMNGQESVSIGPSPTTPSGIASVVSNPVVSTALNLGLAAVSPHLGLANMGLLGLTGTAIPGQMASVFSGQGLQTGGGLMGMMGGSGPSFGSAPSNAGVAEGYGGYGGYEGYPAPTMPEPIQTAEIAPAPKPTTAPAIKYDLSNFISKTPSTPSSAGVIAAVPTFYDDYLRSMGYRG